MDQFYDIYTKYYVKLSHFAWFYVHNNQAAEDIATDSMIKLWETMTKETVDKPLSLLLTIMKHKSLDYLKHQLSMDTVMENMLEWQRDELDIRISTLEACDPEDIFSKEIQDILIKTLHELPKQTRKVFIMSRYEQKSGKEIAEALGITVKGVDYHLGKALKLLRVSLKDYLLLFSFLFLMR